MRTGLVRCVSITRVGETMTDLHSKRRYAGEPHKDKRGSPAPDIERLPPHRKPKVWRLALEWTETTTYRRERVFTSRAARDEARVRIERHFREQAQKAAQPKKYRRWWGINSPFAEFDDIEVSKLKTEPVYVETYEDDVTG